MTRAYAEPVEVRRGLVEGREAPVQFLWRGRLYLVRSVLTHWVQTGAWWSAPAARGVYGLLTGPEAQPVSGVAAGPTVGVAVGVVDDAEEEVWRVEAAAGRASPVGIYDLRLSWPSGDWVLLRTYD